MRDSFVTTTFDDPIRLIMRLQQINCGHVVDEEGVARTTWSELPNGRIVGRAGRTSREGLSYGCRGSDFD